MLYGAEDKTYFKGAQYIICYWASSTNMDKNRKKLNHMPLDWKSIQYVHHYRVIQKTLIMRYRQNILSLFKNHTNLSSFRIL